MVAEGGDVNAHVVSHRHSPKSDPEVPAAQAYRTGSLRSGFRRGRMVEALAQHLGGREHDFDELFDMLVLALQFLAHLCQLVVLGDKFAAELFFQGVEPEWKLGRLA